MSVVEKWIVEIIAVPYGIRLLVDRATSPLKRPMRKLRQVEKADAGGGVWRRTRHNSWRPHHRHIQQHLRRRLQAGKCPERQDLSKNFLSLRPSYQFEFECVLSLWLILKAPILRTSTYYQVRPIGMQYLFFVIGLQRRLSQVWFGDCGRSMLPFL